MRRKKLDILGIVYTVIESTEEACPDLEARYGCTDFDRKIIYLRKTDPPDVKQDTLLHEVGHALIHENGLRAFFDLSLPKSTDREKWEETLLASTIPDLVTLLKRNRRKLWILR